LAGFLQSSGSFETILSNLAVEHAEEEGGGKFVDVIGLLVRGFGE
jgi:hypothetical protein